MKRFLQLFFLVFLTGFLNARIMDILRADDLDINLLIGTGSFFIASVLIFSLTKPRSPERLLRTYSIYSLSWLLLDISSRLVPGEWHGSISACRACPVNWQPFSLRTSAFQKRLSGLSLAL